MLNGYAADGDDDGWADVYNPADAIYGAVKYLCASGAPADVRQALHAYNHSWPTSRTYSPRPSATARSP
ncbi:hypothetical protein [Nonomuraea dietziae]|uniref:hypothetical protein n=1 Tax=Nonomuraea dietziae TaxID=65515 RepID=UPI0031DAB124